MVSRFFVEQVVFSLALSRLARLREIYDDAARMSADVDRYVIRLEGIRFRARHGVSDAERDLPQDFVVDLEVRLPIAVLPASDDRRAVYDYDVLATLVVEEGTRTSYRLLESLSRRLLERVLSDTPAVGATVRVRKFGPPTAASVDTVAVELSANRAGPR